MHQSDFTMEELVEKYNALLEQSNYWTLGGPRLVEYVNKKYGLRLQDIYAIMEAKSSDQSAQKQASL